MCTFFCLPQRLASQSPFPEGELVIKSPDKIGKTTLSTSLIRIVEFACKTDTLTHWGTLKEVASYFEFVFVSSSKFSPKHEPLRTLSQFKQFCDFNLWNQNFSTKSANIWLAPLSALREVVLERTPTGNRSLSSETKKIS